MAIIELCYQISSLLIHYIISCTYDMEQNQIQNINPNFEKLSWRCRPFNFTTSNCLIVCFSGSGFSFYYLWQENLISTKSLSQAIKPALEQWLKTTKLIHSAFLFSLLLDLMYSHFPSLALFWSASYHRKRFMVVLQSCIYMTGATFVVTSWNFPLGSKFRYESLCTIWGAILTHPSISLPFSCLSAEQYKWSIKSFPCFGLLFAKYQGINFDCAYSSKVVQIFFHTITTEDFEADLPEFSQRTKDINSLWTTHTLTDLPDIFLSYLFWKLSKIRQLSKHARNGTSLRLRYLKQLLQLEL